MSSTSVASNISSEKERKNTGLNLPGLVATLGPCTHIPELSNMCGILGNAVFLCPGRGSEVGFGDCVTLLLPPCTLLLPNVVFFTSLVVQKTLNPPQG